MYVLKNIFIKLTNKAASCHQTIWQQQVHPISTCLQCLINKIYSSIYCTLYAVTFGSFLPTRIRIRIQPTKINGDPDLQHCLNVVHTWWRRSRWGASGTKWWSRPGPRWRHAQPARKCRPVFSVLKGLNLKIFNDTQNIKAVNCLPVPDSRDQATRCFAVYSDHGTRSFYDLHRQRRHLKSYFINHYGWQEKRKKSRRLGSV
jgi:hypothetical protein